MESIINYKNSLENAALENKRKLVFNSIKDPGLQLLNKEKEILLIMNYTFLKKCLMSMPQSMGPQIQVI